MSPAYMHQVKIKLNVLHDKLVCDNQAISYEGLARGMTNFYVAFNNSISNCVCILLLLLVGLTSHLCES